jgi:hypothetical protein
MDTSLWAGIAMLAFLSIVSMFFLATRIEALGRKIDAFADLVCDRSRARGPADR